MYIVLINNSEEVSITPNRAGALRDAIRIAKDMFIDDIITVIRDKTVIKEMHGMVFH